jgi:hypothetical protein
MGMRMKGMKMSQTLKRILNIEARPEQQVLLKQVVVIYSVPGSTELHHQWLNMDPVKIVPDGSANFEVLFQDFKAHNG